MQKQVLGACIAATHMGMVNSGISKLNVRNTKSLSEECQKKSLEKQRNKTVKRAISSFKQNEKWVNDNIHKFYSVDNMCIFLYEGFVYIRPKNITELLDETNKSKLYFSKKLTEMTYTLKFNYQNFIELLGQFHIFLIDHLRVNCSGKQIDIDQMYQDIGKLLSLAYKCRLDESKVEVINNLIEKTVTMLGVISEVDKRNSENYFTRIPPNILGDSITHSDYGWIGKGKYYDHLDKSIDLAIFMCLIYVPTACKMNTECLNKDDLNLSINLVEYILKGKEIWWNSLNGK